MDPQNPEVVLIADEDHNPFLAVHWLSLRQPGGVRVLPPGERPAHAAA